jgi:hypothetical protein
MKRVFFVALIAMVSCKSNTSSNTNSNQLPVSLISNPHTADGVDTVAAARKPIMSFADTLHDFGNINENEKVSYDFAFKNTGPTPLIISGAMGSCGCTVADYPHDPIAPGAGGVMKVTFSSVNKSGHQEKSVSVHTNSLRGLHMLYIKGDIVKKEGN